MFNGYVLCFFVVAFSPTVCSHPIELIDSGQTLGQNRKLVGGPRRSER